MGSRRTIGSLSEAWDAHMDARESLPENHFRFRTHANVNVVCKVLQSHISGNYSSQLLQSGRCAHWA